MLSLLWLTFSTFWKPCIYSCLRLSALCLHWCCPCAIQASGDWDFFFPSLKSGWALYAVKFFCAVQISWGRFLWWTFPDSSLCCCGTSASWRCSLFVAILLLLLAIFSWLLQNSGLKTPEAIPLLFFSIWPDLMLMRPRDTDFQSPLSVLWHGWLCISWFPDL